MRSAYWALGHTKYFRWNDHDLTALGVHSVMCSAPLRERNGTGHIERRRNNARPPILRTTHYALRTLWHYLRFSLLSCIILFFLFPCFPVYAQDEPSGNDAPAQFFLAPAASTSLRLHTHTADFRLAYDGNLLIGSVDALYRVQNSDDAAQTITLKLVSEPSAAPPDNLVLLVANQPVALAPMDNGDSVVEVQVDADSTLDLRLSYAFSLDGIPLTTLRYDTRLLRQWSGQPSVRMSIAIPDTIVAESWLLTSPPDWNFAPDEAQLPRIRWLFDERLPDQPFLFQFIHPAQWQELQQAEQAGAPGAPTANFVRLGNLYQQLYIDAADDGLRERFYAQALAAYTAGLENASAVSAPAPEQAALHAGLAMLYRSRVADGDGAVNQTYTDLMTSAANLALAGLPADDTRRNELLQWQVEGLTMQLNTARNRRDWALAAVVLEQLAALPPEAVDPATLAETQRALTVQQALELVEQGDTDAAMTLLGDQLTNTELLPPANARALFVAWQVTVTIGTEQTTVTFNALPAPDRQAEAQVAIETLRQLWDNADTANDYTIALQQEAAAVGGVHPFQLTVTFPASTTGAALVRLMPPGADWALLQTLLAQLGPRVEQTTRWLHQQVDLSQPLDLRSASEQWAAVAATLEQQAGPLEAQSPHINLADVDTVSAETALRSRIKAANYRKAAREWRTLARNSLVVAELVAGAGVQSVTRTWLVTPETPLQTLELQATVMSLGRLLGAAVASFAGLFVLAGVLWWML